MLCVALAVVAQHRDLGRRLEAQARQDRLRHPAGLHDEDRDSACDYCVSVQVEDALATTASGGVPDPAVAVTRNFKILPLTDGAWISIFTVWCAPAASVAVVYVPAWTAAVISVAP